MLKYIHVLMSAIFCEDLNWSHSLYVYKIQKIVELIACCDSTILLFNDELLT